MFVCTIMKLTSSYHNLGYKNKIVRNLGSQYIFTSFSFFRIPILFYKIIIFRLLIYILYTAKLSRGKTFAVVHKTHYSLENFRGTSGPCHYVLSVLGVARYISNALRNNITF